MKRVEKSCFKPFTEEERAELREKYSTSLNSLEAQLEEMRKGRPGDDPATTRKLNKMFPPLRIFDLEG